MKAKDMFEKIGYEYVRETSYKFLYRRKDNKDILITFWEDSEEYVIENKYILSYFELQAINKQVEELGWDER